MKKRKRLIAVVLAMAVALGSVCWKPPEAKAVVIDATAAFGAAAATAAINGTTATTLFTGMTTAAAQSSVVTLMGEYATATGAASSGAAFASSIAAGTVLTAAGAIVLTAAAGYAVYKFIEWLREDKGLEAGGEVVPVFFGSTVVDVASGNYVFAPDGVIDYMPYLLSIDEILTFSNSYGLRVYFDSLNGKPLVKAQCYYDGSPTQPYGGFTFDSLDYDPVYFVLRPYSDERYVSVWLYNDGSPSMLVNTIRKDKLGLDVISTLDLTPKPEFQPIPNEIPDTDAVVITGIEGLPQNDPQAAADAIFQTAIDGALDPVVTVEADPTIETDPDTGTETDPDTGIDSDTNTSILDWLKQIWESICNIPSAIAEAIASIFVPSPDFYPTAISNLKDAFSDRMGLLTYPISVLFDFLDRVVNLSDQQPILTWGNIYLPGYATPLVAAGQYNLNDAIGTSQGKSLHDIYLVIVDAIMILAFVDLCCHKYQKIIHN